MTGSEIRAGSVGPGDSALAGGCTLRPAQPGDVPSVVELVRAFEAQHGPAGTTEADIRSEWAQLARPEDAVVIELPGKAGLAAYGRAEVSPDEAFIDGYVHPAHQGRGLGRALFRELAARSAGRASRLRAGCLAADGAAAELFAGEGLTFVRRFNVLALDLDAARVAERPAPPLPPGVTLRPLQPGEERAFHRVTEAAFAGSWGFEAVPFERWLEQATVQQAYVPALWLVAVAAPGAGPGEGIAGAVRCLPERSGGGWVRTLAVDPAWRGRGLGAALLHAAFLAFAERGERTVALGVDTGNATGALALYERAGMALREATDIWELSDSAEPPVPLLRAAPPPRH